MKRILLLAIGVLVLAPHPGAGAASRAAPHGKEDEQAVRDAEARRFDAMVRADTAALDTLLADDLTYTHSSGQFQMKRQCLADLQAGKLKYEFISPEGVQVRIYGTTAVVTGRARLQVRPQGQASGFQVRFTDVYVKRNGRWQMVAWQSTRLPEP